MNAIGRLKAELLQYEDIENFVKETGKQRNIKKWVWRFLSAPYILASVPFRRKIFAEKFQNLLENDRIFCFRRKDREIKVYLPFVRYKNNMVKGDLIQTEIFRKSNFYEIQTLEYLRKKKYLKKQMNILDIGANIGNHTLYFIKEMEAKKLYCFEPVNTTYKILKRNMQINKITNASIYNFALGREKRTAEIASLSKENWGGATLSYSEKGDIKIYALDELEILEKIDFVKIDVEGFEEEVISGGRKKIQKDKPVIFIEIFSSNFKKINSFMEEIGYILKENLGRDNYIYVNKDTGV